MSDLAEHLTPSADDGRGALAPLTNIVVNREDDISDENGADKPPAGVTPGGRRNRDDPLNDASAASAASAASTPDWSGTARDMQGTRPWDYSEVARKKHRYSMTNSICDPFTRCGARRLGRMYVFCEGARGEEAGEERLDIKCMVGPMWPMLCCTVSLILGISVAVYAFTLPHLHWAFAIVGTITLILVLFALQRTACVDPGVVPRRTVPPPEGEEGQWRWNDHAQSWLPTGSHFCEDTCVVGEEVDHFCPWTGTLIAKKNLRCFQWFNGLLLVQFLVVVGFLVTWLFAQKCAGGSVEPGCVNATGGRGLRL